MLVTKEKLIRAREISTELSQGINPLTNKTIEDCDFLNDPRMIRYFSFLSDVLTNNIEGRAYEKVPKAKPKRFYLLPEEVGNIALPTGSITISILVDAVNEAVDLKDRKKLSAMHINNQLKKMGLLKTVTVVDGKNQTRVTENGSQRGIMEEEVERDGRNYFRISYSESGKMFLLNNLIDILNYSAEEE